MTPRVINHQEHDQLFLDTPYIGMVKAQALLACSSCWPAKLEADPMVPDRKILALGNVIKEGGGLDVVIRRRGFVVQDDDDGEAPFSKADGVPDSDPANRQNNHSIQTRHTVISTLLLLYVIWSKSLQV